MAAIGIVDGIGAHVKTGGSFCKVGGGKFSAQSRGSGRVVTQREKNEADEAATIHARVNVTPKDENVGR